MNDNAAPHDIPIPQVHPSPSTQLLLDPSDIDAEGELDLDLDIDIDGFDPATLANLAALSRIAGDAEGEGEGGGGGGGGVGGGGDGEDDFGGLLPSTGEQVQALVDGLRREQERENADKENGDEVEGEGENETLAQVEEDGKRGMGDREEVLREKSVGFRDDQQGDTGTRSGTEERSDDEGDEDGRGEDGEFGDSRYTFEGKSKRKRNRTVL
jgi:hypothetical protein